MTSKKNNEPVKPEEQSTSSSLDTSTQDKTTTETEAPKTKAPKNNDKSASKPQPEPVEFEEKQGKRGVKLGTAAIIISLLLSGGVTFFAYQQHHQQQLQISALKKQLAQTQTALEQQLSQVATSTVKQAKAEAEKNRVQIQQQHTSIESLQVALADVKGRRPNDWLLAEADYLVKMAGRKLFIEQDAVSATKLIESADQRIAALNDPSLMPLRQVLAKDLIQLRAVPLIDRDGLVAKLTALQLQVDKLPLANAILPKETQVAHEQVSEDITNWRNNLKTSLKDFSEHFITFRKRDGNVVPLLSPEQHFYLRENIKGKLETAIKAVYDENGDAYQTALTTAAQWSQTFFNQEDDGVTHFSRALEGLAKTKVTVDYPVKLETPKQLADVIRDRVRRDVTTLTTLEDK